MASNVSKLYPEQVTAGLTADQFRYLRARGHSVAEAMRKCIDRCLTDDSIPVLEHEFGFTNRAGQPTRATG